MRWWQSGLAVANLANTLPAQPADGVLLRLAVTRSLEEKAGRAIA